MESENYINWFRNASPYVFQHRNKVAVVMLPGEFIEAPYLSNIVNDIAVLSGLGVKIVVVHGSRKQIDSELALRNTASKFHKGVRITEQEHMPSILNAVGNTRYQIEAAFSCGLPSSPMHGSRLSVRSGNFVNAKPKGVVEGVDYQYTGEIRSVDADGILELLHSNNIVVVPPLGYSLTGELFNLSFADVAVGIASAIHADKFITYNDEGQIVDAEERSYREMTLLQCKKFLVETQRHHQNNTYFSLQACHSACDGGVSRAHIVSATEDGAILKELYTRDGSGTMIYRDSYETVRRARIEDVAGILNLIEPLEQEGVLVKRSRERLETEISCFTVIEKENFVVGCAALYPIADSKFAEVACVAIHPEYRGGGRAQKLLLHIERQAARLGAHTLFVLTTQTSHWFIEHGFNESKVEALPVERQHFYNLQRKSKVFTKRITVRATTVDLP